jgi:ketosteroid isomerase-like protein
LSAHFLICFAIVADRIDESSKLGFLVKVQSEQIHIPKGIKLLHTAIWLFFAGCIVAIPIAGDWCQFRWVAVLSGLVLVECAVRAMNQRRCSLTQVYPVGSKSTRYSRTRIHLTSSIVALSRYGRRHGMYHAIVKRIALQNLLRVNQKDYTPILKGCSPDIHHRFGGHHALGGERHDREALRRWFERLGRLAPTLQLTVHDVWVKGGPWNTTVIMRWSAVQDLPDGSPYNNHGVHIIRMRWGKVFDIDANEDSQLVAASLQIWAKYGVNEALADPILS